MDEIRIIELDKNDSFDRVHEILWAANEQNRKDGFRLSTSEMSGEKLKKRVGEDGKCFLALDGEKPVATSSLRLINRRTWYAKGRVANYMLAGVIPEYQGKHINSMLAEKIFAAARAAGCDLIELDTAETNRHAIAVYEHQGFRLLSYKANPGGDHYSVIMGLWPDGCPFSKGKCRRHYHLRKLYIRLRYKPNKKKRFGI